jgi:hypothetical protein
MGLVCDGAAKLELSKRSLPQHQISRSFLRSFFSKKRLLT